MLSTPTETSHQREPRDCGKRGAAGPAQPMAVLPPMVCGDTTHRHFVFHVWRDRGHCLQVKRNKWLSSFLPPLPLFPYSDPSRGILMLFYFSFGKEGH